MTKELKEAAEALINRVETIKDELQLAQFMSYWPEYKTLKAALRPSREEIAQWLNRIVQLGYDEAVDKQYLEYAIEELRK